MNRKEGKTEMIKSITHSFSAQRKLGTFFYHALMIDGRAFCRSYGAAAGRLY